MSVLVRGFSCVSRRLIGLSLLAVIAATGSASAQFGRAAGFSEVQSPYFLSRDLQIFDEGLGLDDGQSMILQSLYWDYADDNDADTDLMKQRFEDMSEELRDQDRSRVLQIVFQPFEEKSAKWERLNEQFLESVRAILNDEQLDRWPEFRRKLRREKQISKGELSGESVNLFHVIRELDYEEPARMMINHLLDDYDKMLDEALLRRQRLLREYRMMTINAIRGEDPEEMISNHNQLIAARIAVRRVNDDYIEAIGDGLPAEIGPKFRRAALERGYDRIYRLTSVQRMFDAALKLDGLTAGTLTAIEELQRSYLAELDAVNNSLLRMIRDYEPESERQRASSFALRGTGRQVEKTPDPTREEFRNRDSMGKRYVDQLKAILTPEQFDSLPGSHRLSSDAARSKPSRRNAAGSRSGVGVSPPNRPIKRGGGGAKEGRGGNTGQGGPGSAGGGGSGSRDPK